MKTEKFIYMVQIKGIIFVVFLWFEITFIKKLIWDVNLFLYYILKINQSRFFNSCFRMFLYSSIESSFSLLWISRSIFGASMFSNFYTLTLLKTLCYKASYTVILNYGLYYSIPWSNSYRSSEVLLNIFWSWFVLLISI